MKILISINSAWNVYNFRTNLIKKLLELNNEVIILAPHDYCVDKLKIIGCKYIKVDIKRKSINVFTNLILLYQYIKILNKLKPDILLLYTIKPNIIGGLASRILKIKTINNITGLGSNFISKNIFSVILIFLYKISLKNSHKVIFHNNHDRNFFINKKISNDYNSITILGSGVDKQRFNFQKYVHKNNYDFHFLFIGRLIKDKGIYEYIKAAEYYKTKYPNMEFNVLGILDYDNPSSISREQFLTFKSNQFVNFYLNQNNDLVNHIKLCDCLIFPSYREGLPKSILECFAVGRPVIASNVVGCNELIKDKYNGYLFNSQDTESLINCIDRFINTDKNLIDSFIKINYKDFLALYEDSQIISKYLQAIYE